MTEGWAGWIGRTERTAGTVEAWPAAALTAALGRDDPPAAGDALPPYWHHLYARSIVRADRTGPDGHPARGDLVPPVAGRRMWAGGRVTWHRALRIGDRVERTSTVRAVREKVGRSGALVFVTVEHCYAVGDRIALVEEQDVVYREGGRVGTPPPAPETAAWQASWRADPVLLFRYSALTYNGHRIHYDRAYAQEVEGYPDLVVHGPLLATLMLDLVRCRRPETAPVRFAFAARSPVLVDRPIIVAGRPETNVSVRVWVAHGGGGLAMDGVVEFGR